MALQDKSSSQFPTSNDHIVYWIEAIENSTSTSGNYSSMTVRVWVKRTNTGYTTYGTGTVYCTINGTQYSASISSTQKITSTAIKIFEKTLNVNHNSDGTKTLTMSSYIDHSQFTSSSHSWSLALTTIARTSQPSLSASSVNYGSSVTIYTNRADSSFTHTLRYSWNGHTGTIATGVTTSYAWTVPNSFMDYIPDKTSTSGTIYCDTYSGSTKIGTKSVTLTTTVPSSVVPTFTSVTATEANTTVANAGTGYVQGLSQLKMTVNGASGVYSSTITKYSFSFEGNTYTSNNAVSSAIKGSGSLTLTATITDSRGRTASKSTTITVNAYASPKINTFTIARANSDGTLNAMGTYVKVTIGGTWNSLNAKNGCTIYVKTSDRGANSWTTKQTISGGTGGSYSGAVTIGTYSATSSYDFRLEFVDLFNTTISLTVLSTGQVTMSWAPTGIGLGKVWEQGTLDVEGDTYVNGDINATNIITTTITADSITTARSLYMNDGKFGINMQNSDIIGINNLVMNDAMENSNEGIWALKSGKTIGSTNVADYDVIRFLDGQFIINDKVVSIDTTTPLWTGGYYMNESQTITPTRAISDCPNGWALLWSDFNTDTSAVNDYNFAITFIHKGYVAKFSGTGQYHAIISYMSATSVTICTKYLYATDTTIHGDLNNDEAGNNSNDVVLRNVFAF